MFFYDSVLDVRQHTKMLILYWKNSFYSTKYQDLFWHEVFVFKCGFAILQNLTGKRFEVRTFIHFFLEHNAGFPRKIILSSKAHFTLCGFVNKQIVTFRWTKFPNNFNKKNCSVRFGGNRFYLIVVNEQNFSITRLLSWGYFQTEHLVRRSGKISIKFCVFLFKLR